MDFLYGSGTFCFSLSCWVGCEHRPLVVNPVSPAGPGHTWPSSAALTHFDTLYHLPHTRFPTMHFRLLLVDLTCLPDCPSPLLPLTEPDLSRVLVFASDQEASDFLSQMVQERVDFSKLHVHKKPPSGQDERPPSIPDTPRSLGPSRTITTVCPVLPTVPPHPLLSSTWTPTEVNLDRSSGSGISSGPSTCRKTQRQHVQIDFFFISVYNCAHSV